MNGTDIAVNAWLPEAGGKAAGERPSGRGLWYAGPWLAVVLVVGIVCSLTAGVVEQAGPWFFLASVLLFGLSHGASDVWLARVVSQLENRPWSVTRFVLGYLGLMAAVVAGWQLAALPVFAMFLLLTAWHWGSADAVAVNRGAVGGWLGWLSLARGAWVILAPFAWHLEEVSMLLRQWGWLDPASAAAWPWTDATAWVVLWMAAVAADLKLAARLSDQRDGTVGFYRGDLIVLIPAAILLPPLWWIGIYFMAFHAWRHGLRLQQLECPHPTPVHEAPAGFSSGRLRGVLRKLMLDHWGYWLGAVVLWLAFGWWWHGRLNAGVIPWTGAYVMWLAALTVPHALLVHRLDRVGQFKERFDGSSGHRGRDRRWRLGTQA